MSAPAQAASRGGEREFLEGLRSRYEADGFTFTMEPDRSKLPAFMGSYAPDALAQKPGRNIAIEIKSRQSQATQYRLQDIRRLFEGHPDWQFSVFFPGSGPLEWATIRKASPATIRERIDEVLELIEQDHLRPAFVMAWSLLEAALQSVVENEHSLPRSPGTVVQTLAMNGYIGADTERRIRDLIVFRNQIVHGDVMTEPTAEDVKLILSAAEQTLDAGAP